MSASVRSVRLNEAELDRLLRSPRGTVGRHLGRIGGYVTREAKSLADQRLERRTGEYAAGFRTTTPRLAGRELRTTVTNSSGHATFIERGTRPHVILPRNGPYLVFTAKSGAVVFARRVNHPGTRPYRILEDALRIGMRRAR